jgi:hypothetical protein
MPKKSRSAEKVWICFLSKCQEVRLLFSQSARINKLIKKILKIKQKNKNKKHEMKN